MSFGKSERKVARTITPVKIKGERRNNTEVEVTVKNTLHSAWTPNKGGVLNDQLFEERKVLIGHWFENWTDPQRRQFLEHLVQKFNKMSVHFVHNMIKGRLPTEPEDFTRGLPQHLSIKILGYLDPRTLAQASLVSWHWKWLCEHDGVWKPKCLRRGWDYGKPEPPYERAVWKRFYQQKVWDLLHPPPPPVYEIEEDGGNALNTSLDSNRSRRSSAGNKNNNRRSGAGPVKAKSYKLGETHPHGVGYLKHKEEELPPWRSSDLKPKDMQLFNKAILNINSESVPRHISEKFQKVEIISRNPGSPRCTQTPKKSGSKERIATKVTPSQMKSKSMVNVHERKILSPVPGQILKSNSLELGSNLRSTPVRKHSVPNKKSNAQDRPMARKLTGISTKTMTKAANRGSTPRGKKGGAGEDDDVITIPNAWGQARKVASTDTLGSDAALEIESNDSLYGDDSGKLSGEAWELHSNISDQ